MAIRYNLINIQHLKYDLPKILKLLFSLFLVVLQNTAGYKSIYSFNLLRLWLFDKIVTYLEGTLCYLYSFIITYLLTYLHTYILTYLLAPWCRVLLE